MTETMAAQVKERPILFSGEMVRRLLAGEKTQTRRVLKPQPRLVQEIRPVGFYCGYEWKSAGESGHAFCVSESRLMEMLAGDEDYSCSCPYGQPGDRLWVRENWSPDGVSLEAAKELNRHPIHYRADGEAPKYLNVKWKPSIHLPRKYSRISLEIVGIRVERIQDISQEDARAEGRQCIAHFRQTWEALNGKRGFGWNDNPWVWVIEFKRLTA